MAGENGFADLHVHSSHSDGSHSVEALLRMAHERSINAISITDHDSIDAIPEAVELTSSGKYDVEVIPGVEITSEYRGVEVHMLGYLIDHTSSELIDALTEMRRERMKRLFKIVARLNQLGIRITVEDVLSQAHGEAIGRPHVARALVQLGYAEDYLDAFQRYLRDAAPAYVPRKRISCYDAIRLIHRAKGLAVLAHPCDLGNLELVCEVVKCGADGIEAFHPRLSKADSERLVKLAANFGLIITGGTDFHSESNVSVRLGDIAVPYAYVLRLRERHSEFFSKRAFHLSSRFE
ncbi:MAG: PHP domain-containing protein [Armatimonadota bacterium]|nr:PHP domain-containing protein [Armatimonadota bacterium]MCX7776471.1 PHP domain-containing protein [Armatimonadota bacterium]MDW8024268.1 PHP domain-containing protein [Armatimonadota bacterium]